MHLSYNKFSVAGYLTAPEKVNIYCTVCGSMEDILDANLNDLVYWAEQHDCSPLTVT